MTARFPDIAPGAYFRPLNLGAILESGVAACTGHEIVSDGGRYGYQEIAARVEALAFALAAAGVEEGTTVAVLDWDTHRYLECYFAIPMMGAILQMVNPRIAPDQIRYALESTSASVLIYHSDFQELVQAIGAAERIPTLIPISADVADSYEARIGRRGRFTFRDIPEDAVATVFHTSGTTGRPKPVSFTHRQLVLHTLALATGFGFQRHGYDLSHDDVYMPLTPMFHVHAWGLPFVATMMGLKQVYPGRYDMETILQLKTAERVTFSHCVPTILQMLLAAHAGDGGLSGWKMVIGGTAFPLPLHHAAAAAGITTFAGYGMSEAPPVSLSRPSNRPDNDSLALTRAGRPIPLVSTRIVTADGSTGEWDGEITGELQLRAPWLTASYAGEPAASIALWDGGWLHTGDVASIDDDATLIIRDRLKDLVKSGGEWISSSELEAFILECPLVLEAAVIGVSDERWGERPVAFIVPTPGSSPHQVSIAAHLEAYVASGKITRYAVPGEIVVVPSLPRTSVGKIDKVSLRARYPQARRAPA